MPTSANLEPQSGDDEPSVEVTSRENPDLDEEWTLEDERRHIWGLRRMTLGFLAVFLVSLYFAWDGTNEGAAFRAALFAVPAAGLLVAQIVFEVKHHREYRELLEAQRDVTRQIADNGTV